MNDLQQSTRRIYEFFAGICKIPHPSYHCEGIRKFLKQTAEKHNLKYREDGAGNVRLDRKNGDFASAIALQSHMDMVPQSVDPDFDFTVRSIEFEEVNGILRSKDCRTTLGADNGIGMAASLCAMTDENLEDLPLCAIFTVDEETGLTGAMNIAPEFLECRALFNLDSEEWGELTTGCAGGAHTTTRIPVQKQTTPQECTAGIHVSCHNLKGGHSGTDINLNRGNAILILLDYISKSGVEVSTIKGGNLANAIPRSAEFTGAVQDFDKLLTFTEKFKENVRRTFDVPSDFDITVEKLDEPPTGVIDNFGHIALFLKSIPSGVIAVDEALECVATSNNMAIIKGDTNTIEILMSQRSIRNIDRERLSSDIADRFAKIGGETVTDAEYSAWESTTSAQFLKLATDTYKELFNAECKVKIIHAGLECGLFQEKNPQLPMLSFGPTIRNPHSPSEELELATLKDFYNFLAVLAKKILKK